MPESLVKLGIIFVLYHSYDEFENFLARQGPLPDGLRLIVVDNTPHSHVDRERLANWEERYGIIACIATPENLGYSGAAHFAMRTFPDLYTFDYVAISNTDVSYRAGEVFRILQETAVEHVGVGAIAPRLTYSDGGRKAQLHYVKKPSREKFEKLVQIFSFYYLALAHRIAGDFKRKFGFARDKGEIPREIFAPHGAFMIMTRAYFSSTGGFAHPCFLFLEEIYIGHECEKAGLSCIYEPLIAYSHENHGAMGSILSRRMVSYIHEAHKAVLPMLE